jgi:hypothetical protein
MGETSKEGPTGGGPGEERSDEGRPARAGGGTGEEEPTGALCTRFTLIF